MKYYVMSSDVAPETGSTMFLSIVGEVARAPKIGM